MNLTRRHFAIFLATFVVLLSAAQTLTDGNYSSEQRRLENGDTIHFLMPHEQIGSQSIELAISAPAGKGVWSLALIGESTPKLLVKITPPERELFGFGDSGFPLLSVWLGDSILLDRHPIAEATAASRPNHIKINCDGSTAQILIGKSRLFSQATVDSVGGFFSSAILTADAPLTLLRSITSSSPLPKIESSGYDSVSAVELAVRQSSHPYSSIWRMLDFVSDSGKAIPGGNYRIATIPQSGDELIVLYLDGAKINASDWPAASIKGYLKSTPLSGVYDLRWIDSQGKEYSDGLSATFDPPFLILSFPTLGTTLRFVKEQ